MQIMTPSYLEYMSEYIESEDETSYSKKTFHSRDNIQSLVSKSLNEESNREKIIDFVNEFVDTHAKHFETSGPVHMFTFTEHHAEVLYNICEVSKDLIMETFAKVKEDTYSKKLSSFLIPLCSPHKILITSIMVESLQKEYDDVFEACEYLMGFAEYPLLYRGYWSIGVQENIMNYTIEHLRSKFKAKKLNNILQLLKYDINSSTSRFRNALTIGQDKTYVDLIYRIRTQLNNTFKNIAREYYKNHENNATQHTISGTLDDGSISDMDGYMSMLSSTVDNVYNKFIKTPINTRLISISTDFNKVDKAQLTAFLNQIFTSKDNKLHRCIENIITLYMSDNNTGNAVGTKEFLNFGIVLYRSIGTSKKTLQAELKNILNLWMHDIINITTYYPSKGTTVINYTRAIFYYIVLMINSIAQ